VCCCHSNPVFGRTTSCRPDFWDMDSPMSCTLSDARPRSSKPLKLHHHHHHILRTSLRCTILASLFPFPFSTFLSLTPRTLWPSLGITSGSQDDTKIQRSKRVTPTPTPEQDGEGCNTGWSGACMSALDPQGNAHGAGDRRLTHRWRSSR
jgi:hypothetical protein